MKLNTNPLKKKYPVIVRGAGFTGIILLILVFVVFPRFINESEFSKVKEVEIDTIDINFFNGGHNTFCNKIASDYTTEYINKNNLNFWIF